MDAEATVAPQKLFEYYAKKARRFHIRAIKSIGLERVWFGTLAAIYQKQADQFEQEAAKLIEL
jgi:uncharacterized protein YukE